MGGTASGVVEAADHAQSARVFFDMFDHTDHLFGPVLPINRQAHAAFGKSASESAGLNFIFCRIGNIEQSGIACKAGGL